MEESDKIHKALFWKMPGCCRPVIFPTGLPATSVTKLPLLCLNPFIPAASQPARDLA